MQGVVLAVRIAGGAMLMVAGAGKLADRAGARVALSELRVPAPLVPALVVLVPIVELAIGAALLPAATAAVAATAAAVLFAMFAAAMAAALRRGESPDCHCFGVLHSSRVAPPAVARTALFAAAAVLVAWAEWTGTPNSAIAWIGELSAVGAVAAAEGAALVLVLAGGGWLAMHLLRQHGRLIVRLDALERATGVVPASGALARPPGLEVGAPAPPLALAGLSGERWTLEDRALLVFADAGCGPCRGLFAELADWPPPADGTPMVVVLSGDPSVAAEIPPGVDVVLDPARGAQEAYGIPGTPCGVLVAGGRIASDPAPGAEAVRRLLGSDRPVLEVHSVA